MANNKIITMANQKGGTGKTTTCCNLGHALADMGNRVLLVDFDPQSNLSMSFGIERPDELEMSMSDILTLVIDGKLLPYKTNDVLKSNNQTLVEEQVKHDFPVQKRTNSNEAGL